MLVRKLSYSYTSVLGIGFIPFASGTWGSLFAIITYHFFLSHLPLSFSIMTVTSLSAISILLSNFIIPDKSSDPKHIVIDEVIGMWITCILAPNTIWWLCAAFLLFRLLDITKLPPVNLLEKLHGGLGIIADDIGAGLIAGFVLFIAGAILM